MAKALVAATDWQVCPWNGPSVHLVALLRSTTVHALSPLGHWQVAGWGCDRKKRIHSPWYQTPARISDQACRDCLEGQHWGGWTITSRSQTCKGNGHLVFERCRSSAAVICTPKSSKTPAGTSPFARSTSLISWLTRLVLPPNSVQVMSEDLHYHSVDVASLDCMFTPCSKWLTSSLSFEFQIQLSRESGWGNTPLTDQLPSYEEKHYQHKKLWSNPPSKITASLNHPTSTNIIQHQPTSTYHHFPWKSTILNYYEPPRLQSSNISNPIVIDNGLILQKEISSKLPSSQEMV